jgi:hypothetical protein
VKKPYKIKDALTIGKRNKNNFCGKLETLKARYPEQREGFLRTNASQNPRWGFCLPRRSFSEGGTFPKKLIFVSC